MENSYKNPIGITSQFSFCGLPFRLDTYAGCAYSCTYCFARLRGGNVNTKKIRIANPDLIISKFKNAINKPKYTTGIIAEFIRNQTPLHFGGMSDPFQPIESTKKITLQILKYLCSIQYPLVISTKSNLLANPQYLEILKDNPYVVVQFSFSTIQDSVGELVEPYALKPSEILKAIEHLSKHDVKTTIRWQPYIPNVSDSPTDFVQTANNVGVKHIGFEHLKLPVERDNPLWKKLVSKLQFDITKYYKDLNCVSDGRELVLPTLIKLSTALLVKSECHKVGLSFGAADNEIQHLSDYDCCCSGIDQFIGFENWNKFQIGYAIKKSIGKKIKFSTIGNQWRPQGSIDQYLNSKTRIEKSNGHNKIDHYIYSRWEDLNSPFNPTRYFGVVDTDERDDSGMRVYEWNDSLELENYWI